MIGFYATAVRKQESAHTVVWKLTNPLFKPYPSDTALLKIHW